MRINKKVTAKRVAKAVERAMSSLDSPGFCIFCGAENDGVEPDAREYICECCGDAGVYGAEELLIMIAL